MESSSSALGNKVIPLNQLEILQRSQALNDSLGAAYPLVFAYMISFDEMLNNMARYMRLVNFEQKNLQEEVSYKDLCIFCKERHVIKGTLTDWMFYHALRQKIDCRLDKDTLEEIIRIAPKFCDEANYLASELEKVIKKYRRYN